MRRAREERFVAQSRFRSCRICSKRVSSAAVRRPGQPARVESPCDPSRYPTRATSGMTDAGKQLVRMRMHPVEPKLKKRKKKYDSVKSTDNGDACCAAAAAACPADKSDSGFGQRSETVNCGSSRPVSRGRPLCSAASSSPRLQVAQAARRENSLTDCDEDGPGAEAGCRTDPGAAGGVRIPFFAQPLIRVAELCFSGIPHPHLLGDCRPNQFADWRSSSR